MSAVDTIAPIRQNGRRRLPLSGFLGLFRQRRRLARLDDAALRDLGLTREEALREARRPVWDVPDHWMR